MRSQSSLRSRASAPLGDLRRSGVFKDATILLDDGAAAALCWRGGDDECGDQENAIQGGGTDARLGSRNRGAAGGSLGSVTAAYLGARSVAAFPLPPFIIHPTMAECTRTVDSGQSTRKTDVEDSGSARVEVSSVREDKAEQLQPQDFESYCSWYWQGLLDLHPSLVTPTLFFSQHPNQSGPEEVIADPLLSSSASVPSSTRVCRIVVMLTQSFIPESMLVAHFAALAASTGRTVAEFRIHILTSSMEVGRGDRDGEMSEVEGGDETSSSGGSNGRVGALAGREDLSGYLRNVEKRLVVSILDAWRYYAHREGRSFLPRLSLRVQYLPFHVAVLLSGSRMARPAPRSSGRNRGGGTFGFSFPRSSAAEAENRSRDYRNIMRSVTQSAWPGLVLLPTPQRSNRQPPVSFMCGDHSSATTAAKTAKIAGSDGRTYFNAGFPLIPPSLAPGEHQKAVSDGPAIPNLSSSITADDLPAGRRAQLRSLAGQFGVFVSLLPSLLFSFYSCCLTTHTRTRTHARIRMHTGSLASCLALLGLRPSASSSFAMGRTSKIFGDTVMRLGDEAERAVNASLLGPPDDYSSPFRQSKERRERERFLGRHVREKETCSLIVLDRLLDVGGSLSVASGGSAMDRLIKHGSLQEALRCGGRERAEEYRDVKTGKTERTVSVRCFSYAFTSLSPFHPIHSSICLSVRLSTRPTQYISIRLLISLYLSHLVSDFISRSRSLTFSFPLSLYLSVYLSIYLSIFLFVSFFLSLRPDSSYKPGRRPIVWRRLTHLDESITVLVLSESPKLGMLRGRREESRKGTRYATCGDVWNRNRGCAVLDCRDAIGFARKDNEKERGEQRRRRKRERKRKGENEEDEGENEDGRERDHGRRTQDHW